MVKVQRKEAIFELNWMRKEKDLDRTNATSHLALLFIIQVLLVTHYMRYFVLTAVDKSVKADGTMEARGGRRRRKRRRGRGRSRADGHTTRL